MNVRVRGIYATALTAVLDDAGFDVVAASDPIRERFDAEFPPAEHDARVRTTGDRQGVELSGSNLDPLRAELEGTGRDTLAWTDPMARNAVFDARVERTVGGGAVVDTGAGDAYLPFSATEEHVDTGDEFRVQVRDPAPPWSSERPVVDTDIRTRGGVATLVRGVDATVVGTPDGSPEGELARLTELLPTDVPDAWGVRWSGAADGAGMDTLDAALSTARERAAALDDVVEDEVDAPRQILSPAETVWLWFGRESRFELDERRRGVVPTMAGHHRTKAGSGSASDAVDFVEQIDPPAEFPTGAVLSQFGPHTGGTLAIEHGKPDGRRITLGRGEVTDFDAESGHATVRREMTGGGTYDALEVPREEGDVAVTKFREGRAWYPTVYRSEDGDVRGTYVNVCTPVELFPSAARYVDLHVDVIKHADGTVETVDEDELQASVDAGHTPEPLAEMALDVAERVANGIR